MVQMRVTPNKDKKHGQDISIGELILWMVDDWVFGQGYLEISLACRTPPACLAFVQSRKENMKNRLGGL